MDIIASAITVIGGADGPTSVFIAGKLGDNFWMGLIAAGIVVAGAAVLIWKKRGR